MKVKQYWASTLADAGRARWMTEALMKHLYPPPEYTGPLPEEIKDMDKKHIQKYIYEYLGEMAAWKDYAEAEVKGMGKEKMLGLFENVSSSPFPPSHNFDETLYVNVCVG